VENFFVRAKHWQVFVLVWGAYLAGQAVIVCSHASRTSPGLLTAAAMLPFLICSVLWLWSLGFFLFSIAKDMVRFNIRHFHFAIIFSTLWFTMASPLLSRGGLVAKLFLFPMHFLAMSFLLYAFLFVSKSLAAAEKGGAVTFSEYGPYLFLLPASIIGIWFIQPRINRLYAERPA
jgi:hypothetical protein